MRYVLPLAWSPTRCPLVSGSASGLLWLLSHRLCLHSRRSSVNARLSSLCSSPLSPKQSHAWSPFSIKLSQWGFLEITPLPRGRRWSFIPIKLAKLKKTLLALSLRKGAGSVQAPVLLAGQKGRDDVLYPTVCFVLRLLVSEWDNSGK